MKASDHALSWGGRLWIIHLRPALSALFRRLRAYRRAARCALSVKFHGTQLSGRLGLVAQLSRLDFQPFIVVQIASRDRGRMEHRYVICPTQNEAGAFVAEIAALPEFASSRLVRAVERALQGEVYDAAELLFAWVTEAEASVSEGASADFVPRYSGYPIFMLRSGGRSEPLSGQQKLEVLLRLLDVYSKTRGNDALRYQLIESIAFALARILGSRQDFRAAAEHVERGLQFRPYSIYLKAAKHALALKLADKPVPGRLEKFIGRDSGYLKRFVCPEPFKRFDIGPSGDVLVCCGHWLPTSIGNFMKDGAEAVLNSPKAHAIRRSVTDGSYKYCNHLECAALIQENIPTRNELEDATIRNALEKDDFTVHHVHQVLFAFDRTCNLSCPSCRMEQITEKASESEAKARAINEKLLPLLPKLILNINPAGELFASKPSRRLLELIDDERCPDLKLEIISNGMLFSEEEWKKFPGIHGKINWVRISTDAARKETFETLRRLGKYDIFVKNMRFLARLRADGIIPQLNFSFTYQLQNFREMAEFVAFCREMNGDFTIFERLQNLGAFSDAEFRRKAVHLPEHPLHAEFLDMVRNPVFRSPMVWHDFDYDGVEVLTRDEVRRRLVEPLRVAG